jgi:hypothetical protein
VPALRGQVLPARVDCGRVTDRGLCAAVRVPALQVVLVQGQLVAQWP